jgi:hypothetical protein
MSHHCVATYGPAGISPAESRPSSRSRLYNERCSLTSVESSADEPHVSGWVFQRQPVVVRKLASGRRRPGFQVLQPPVPPGGSSTRRVVAEHVEPGCRHRPGLHQPRAGSHRSTLSTPPTEAATTRGNGEPLPAFYRGGMPDPPLNQLPCVPHTASAARANLNPNKMARPGHITTTSKRTP